MTYDAWKTRSPDDDTLGLEPDLPEEEGPDLTVANHGSICTISGSTPAGQEWLDEHVINDDTLFWAGGVVIEPRSVENVVTGAQADGLTVA